MTTRRYIPEDTELHTRRRENLKSHVLVKDWQSALADKSGMIKNCK
jgi:hypothetical protein